VCRFYLKKRFEHIELPAQLLDYFLQSNKRKSSINLLSKVILSFQFFQGSTIQLFIIAVYVQDFSFLVSYSSETAQTRTGNAKQKSTYTNIMILKRILKGVATKRIVSKKYMMCVCMGVFLG